MSYTIQELGELLRVNQKTIRRWTQIGLKPIDGSKHPLLFQGAELKEFLKNKASKKKVSLEKNEFLCLTCKAARSAKRGSIRVLADRKIALCRVCNGNMSRTFKPSQNDYTISLFPT
jgi:hypothetical protein